MHGNDPLEDALSSFAEAAEELRVGRLARERMERNRKRRVEEERRGQRLLDLGVESLFLHQPD